MKVVLSSKEFKTFISSIVSLGRSNITLTIKNKSVECVSTTDDVSSVYLHSKIFTLEDVNLEGNDFVDIYLKDISKIQKLLEVNNHETFTFEIKGNRLVFSSGRIKDARLALNNPTGRKIDEKRIEKLFGFPVCCTCKMGKADMKGILQAASFADSSEKVYFYVKDGKMVAELNDYEKDNIDNMSIYVSDECEGTMEGKVITLVSNLAKIHLTDSDIDVMVATVANGSTKYNILYFVIEENNVLLRYFLNTNKD